MKTDPIQELFGSLTDENAWLDSDRRAELFCNAINKFKKDVMSARADGRHDFRSKGYDFKNDDQWYNETYLEL